MTETTHAPEVRLKSVVLPVEHGGWGFLIEPMVLGMLVAPSWAGLWICLSALGVFLIHQPLRIALKDKLKGRRFVRTDYAERFAVGYGVFALVTFALAVLASQAPFWIPLLIAVALAGVQLIYEALNRGRELLPELFGAVALGATASAIALAADRSPMVGLILWLLIGLRIIPSVLYVRARLSILHKQATSSLQPLTAHVLALIVVGWMWANGLVLWTSALAMCILLLRAVMGLRQGIVPARTIGFQEIAFGLGYALLAAIGIP
jgi:hypothetical protein